MDIYETYKLIERLGEITRANLRKVATKCGLQPVQVEVLHYLVSCNQFSNTLMSVVDYLGQTKGTVSQTIKSLEAKGFIEKIPDKHDKRTVRLWVTQKGKKLIEQELPGMPFTEALESLDTESQSSLTKSLSALNSALLKTNNMDTFGVCRTCIHNEKHANGYFCRLLNIDLTEDETDKICKEHALKVS
ncbi:winged helix-turn-helix transcriptional regulator [Shewanella sp. Scap07]|uniref:MarR family winged helix-turn-helix transcriptional regulator n=1 Tax=Shewanella sp. Scap07 TaxID=2589987 RepID=UPI0015C18FBE|nr:MarR family winged helix-turn-helix transcriptional regulator [Shewanella sp. Scap07]QLE84169.1 winged helix-turn-helix transcriptional regulator [Shewanella sp. Scap07]